MPVSIQPVVPAASRVVADHSEPDIGQPQSTLELPDFDIRSIDLNSIQNAVVRVSVPLKEGVYWLPGKYEKAKVVVKPNTMAWLTVCVGRHPVSDEAVITKTSIQMSEPVRVANPSSAYEEPGCMNGFRDLFADVLIEGVEIGPDGQVLFQGELKKGLSREDIKTAFKPEMFPNVDLSLERLKQKKVDLKKVGIPELLKQFGGMLGEAKCSARLQMDVPEFTVPRTGLKVRTTHSDLELRVHVRASITPEGELKLKSDEQLQSTAEFGDSKAVLDGDVQVCELAQLKPELDGQVSARTFVPQTQVFVDYEDKTDIPVLMGGEFNYVRAQARFQKNQPVKFSGDTLMDAHVAEVQPLNVGALKAKFKSASFRLDARGVVRGQKKSVCGDFKAVLSHPQFDWRGLHASVRGQAGVLIQAKDLMNGTIRYNIESDRLRPFRRELGYELFPDACLALNPHNTGVSEFLDPVNQFIWAGSQLADPSTPPVGELGDDAWRAHVEKMTGAPIRKHNRVELLIDGKTSFPKRLQLIKNAKRSICLQSLIFKDDECGMATAKALVEAHKRDVAVRVIVDSLGNLDSVKELIRGNRVYEYLRKNGVNLELYSNAAVKGFGNLLRVVEQHRALQGLESLKDFVDPKQTLSTLHMLAKVARGTVNLGLSAEDQQKVRESLKMILGDDDHAHELIERLAHITPEKPLQLSEVIELFTQVLNLNHRWHEKYLIVDGEKAILGGMNIADEYLKGGSDAQVRVAGVGRPAWRDTDIFVEGEGALDAYQYFARNWKTVNGQDIPAEPGSGLKLGRNTEVQVIQSRPLRGLPHPVTNFKIEALKSLKKGDKAYEATAYFMPVGALKPYAEALKLAVARGVDVRIVTNSIDSTDMPQVNQAALVSCYRDLLRAGVRIFERTGGRTMHQKTAAYGSKVGLVGSYNLDNRSASLNSESEVVIYQAEFVGGLEKMLLKDMESNVAKELKLEDIAASPALEELQHSAWAMLGDLM